MANEKKLTFQNAHGENLFARLVEAPEGRGETVIFCHGYAASKDGFVWPQLAAELAALGKSSFRFDFAGNGESQGSFSFGNYSREVEDLRAAVLFVRNYLKKRVYAIVGHSKGGNVVLLYAAKYDDVHYVVNIAGRAIMNRGIKERFGEDILERLAASGWVEHKVRADGGQLVTYKLTKEAVDERMNMDMLGAVVKTHAEVLTIHGSADSTVPPEDAQKYATAIPHHTLAMIEGADHNFRAPGAAAALIKRLTDYLVTDM